MPFVKNETELIVLIKPIKRSWENLKIKWIKTNWMYCAKLKYMKFSMHDVQRPGTRGGMDQGGGEYPHVYTQLLLKSP